MVGMEGRTSGELFVESLVESAGQMRLASRRAKRWMIFEHGGGGSSFLDPEPVSV